MLSQFVRNRLNVAPIIVSTAISVVRNPGPGGYGVVLAYQGKIRKELSGGFLITTNQRMELLAAIEGLKPLKENCYIKLCSSSQYVVKGFTEGKAERWKVFGWKPTVNSTKKIVNSDLWKQLVILTYRREVEFKWVKANSGISGNEVASKLAWEAARSRHKKPDLGYIERMQEAKSNLGRSYSSDFITFDSSH